MTGSARRTTASVVELTSPLRPVVVLAAVVLVALLSCDRGPVVIEPLDPDAAGPQVRDYLQQQLEVARQHPDQVEHRIALGLVYFANGLWREAHLSFVEVSRELPNAVFPPYYAAVAAFRLGWIDQCRGILEDLTARVPGFAPANHLLGVIYLEEGRVDEAEAAYLRVIDGRPKASHGYVGLAEARIRQHRWDDAEALLGQALELGGDKQTAHYLLGLAYRGQGRLEEARVELERGVSTKRRKLMPNRWTTRFQEHCRTMACQVEKSRVFLKQGRTDQAKTVLEEALRYHPDNVPALNNLAVAHMMEGRFEEGLKLLERAESIGSDELVTAINLAECYLGLGRLEESIARARKAGELKPTDVRPLVTMAKALHRSGRIQEAIETLERARELEPDNQAVRMELMRVGSLSPGLETTGPGLESPPRQSRTESGPHEPPGTAPLNGNPGRSP